MHSLLLLWPVCIDCVIRVSSDTHVDINITIWSWHKLTISVFERIFRIRLGPNRMLFFIAITKSNRNHFEVTFIKNHTISIGYYYSCDKKFWFQVLKIYSNSFSHFWTQCFCLKRVAKLTNYCFRRREPILRSSKEYFHSKRKQKTIASGILPFQLGI